MLNWNNAKQATFSYDERETVVSSSNGITEICTSETTIITKILKLYSNTLEVKVDYFTLSSVDGSKIPTQVRVTIPKKQYFTLRSLREDK